MTIVLTQTAQQNSLIKEANWIQAIQVWVTLEAQAINSI